MSEGISIDRWYRALVMFVLLTVTVGAAAFLRLLPYQLDAEHPLTAWLWNFTPIYALLVFSVAQFQRPVLGLLLPLALLAGTDVLLHTSGLAPSTLRGRAWIYGLFAGLSLLGLLLREKRSMPRILAVAAAGPIAFFLLSNFGVWATANPAAMPPDGYPKSIGGLISCYGYALPFLRNDLLGSLIFTFGLFGSWAWLVERQPAKATLVAA